MTTSFDALLAQSRQRVAANLAQLTAHRTAAAATVSAPLPEARPTSHVVRPAWGKLPIDGLCREDAARASNKPGRAGLLAYKKAWGL